jgi:PAS domain S-box-containing protein
MAHTVPLGAFVASSGLEGVTPYARAPIAAAFLTTEPSVVYRGGVSAVKHAVQTVADIPSPFRLFLTVLGIFFCTEAAVMLVLPRLLGRTDDLAALLVDGVLLMVASAPLLWFFVARPLRGSALQQHQRAASVLAHARDGIITIDNRGSVESFNPAAERIFGYAAEEMLGRAVAALLPERYREAHLLALQGIRERAAAGDSERVLVAHGLRKDGSEFPMELSVATWKVAEGIFHAAVVRDITERRQAEESLRARTSQLEAVRAVAEEITRELDLSTVLNLITLRAAELFGVKSGSVLLWNEEAQQLRPRAWCGVGDGFKAVTLGLGEGFAGAVAQRRQGVVIDDDSASPFASPDVTEGVGASALAGQPLLYGDRLLGVIILSNRGTERTFTSQDLDTLGLFADQAAIAIQNARLYEDVQSLAILRERQRIAREMHDSFAQTLGLLHLQLRRALERHGSNDSDLAAVLGDLSALTEHAYDELRQSIFGLRTSMSRGLGWVPTLTEYLHEFSTRTTIPVRLEAAEGLPERLSPATEVQLVRIIQESLANVHKHAGARQARVHLQPEDQWVRVTIEDDGQGFQPDVLAVTKHGHFGLETMRERAESAGGTLQIESAPGRGTRIVATLPRGA